MATIEDVLGFQPRELRTEDYRRIRRNLGKTQKQWSDLLSVPISTIRNWEQGRSKPNRLADLIYQIMEQRTGAFVRSSIRLPFKPRHVTLKAIRAAVDKVAKRD